MNSVETRIALDTLLEAPEIHLPNEFPSGTLGRFDLPHSLCISFGTRQARYDQSTTVRRLCSVTLDARPKRPSLHRAAQPARQLPGGRLAGRWHKASGHGTRFSPPNVRRPSPGGVQVLRGRARRLAAAQAVPQTGSRVPPPSRRETPTCLERLVERWILKSRPRELGESGFQM